MNGVWGPKRVPKVDVGASLGAVMNGVRSPKCVQKVIFEFP